MHPPQNKILNDNISIDFNSLIGKGATGNVFRGLFLDPYPHPIAVKAIPLKEINNQVTSYLLRCQLQALKALANSQTPSVVKLKEITVVDQQCFIGMELLEGGTLKDYLSKVKKLEEKTAYVILQQILEGYRGAKNNGIVHRDLKPGNIMFQKPPLEGMIAAKIIDFGYCRMQRVERKPKMFYNVGSPRYMSPQAYKQNIYSEKSDIWSIGLIFYEMITGVTLDRDKEIPQMFKFIKEKGIPIPTHLSKKSKKLLQFMLMYNPNRRATCETVLEILRQDNLPLQSQIRSQVQSQQYMQYKPMKSTAESRQVQSKFETRNLSLPKTQSPDLCKKTNNQVQSPLRSQKNMITFNQKPFPMNNVSRKVENSSPEGFQYNAMSIEKKMKSTLTPRKEEKGFMYQSFLPVKIHITTLQPALSQKNLHEKPEKNAKQNQKFQSQQNYVRIMGKPQMRNDRVHTQPFQRQSLQKTVVQPSQVIENEYKLFHPMPLTPQGKDRNMKPLVKFQLNNSVELKPQQIQFDLRTSNAFRMNVPQRNTTPNFVSPQKRVPYLPLRQTLTPKTLLR